MHISLNADCARQQDCFVLECIRSEKWQKQLVMSKPVSFPKRSGAVLECSRENTDFGKKRIVFGLDEAKMLSYNSKRQLTMLP